jgi:PGM1 C-terminal domain
VDAEFAALQARLLPMWPSVTLHTARPQVRTVIVVHSIPGDLLPGHLAPVCPAYEERFLCLVLSLLRAPGSRVIYVTSQPALPQVLDYWFGLVKGLDTSEARSRLSLVSPVDGSPRSLTEKLLDRPRLLDRIRRLVVDPELAVIVPFMVREPEARLALKLDVPLYGSSPEAWQLGTKSKARRIFADVGVPLAAGVEDVRSHADLRDALRSLRETRPTLSQAIVKLDQGAGALGNATVTFRGADLDAAIDSMELEDPDASTEWFLAELESGAVVEERLVGAEFRSPSVQLRASPDRDVEILSSHDQVLGGPHGLTFLGCRFPADPAYAPQITTLATRVGERLAREGAIGRFALDFVVVRDQAGDWHPYAIEINLRAGGTTHPFVALQALTDGHYDERRCVFTDPEGRPKYYTATDHLEAPAYGHLTPDDLFEIIEERDLGWNQQAMTGLAFHMISALAPAGRVGATAIADTPGDADTLLTRVRTVLDEESEVVTAGSTFKS